MTLRTTANKTGTKATHLWVEEQTVSTPRERAATDVEVFVGRGEGNLATVSLLLVLQVSFVLHLDVIHPGRTDSD